MRRPRGRMLMRVRDGGVGVFPAAWMITFRVTLADAGKETRAMGVEMDVEVEVQAEIVEAAPMVEEGKVPEAAPAKEGDGGFEEEKVRHSDQ
jgi:hypothetical protein